MDIQVILCVTLPGLFRYSLGTTFLFKFLIRVAMVWDRWVTERGPWGTHDGNRRLECCSLQPAQGTSYWLSVSASL